MKRIFRHGTLLGLAAAAIAAVCFSLGWLERFEYLLYDWRVITLARPSPVTDRIRIVAVDQTSLDWAEEHFDIRWKWPRQIYAPILSFCKRAGATAVVFDVLYTEASDAADPLDDALFGRAIADGAPFVTALPLSRDRPARCRAHLSPSRPSPPTPPCSAMSWPPPTAMPFFGAYRPTRSSTAGSSRHWASPPCAPPRTRRWTQPRARSAHNASACGPTGASRCIFAAAPRPTNGTMQPPSSNPSCASRKAARPRSIPPSCAVASCSSA